MKIVQKIKEPIKEEMEVFEKKFKNSMMSKISLLNRITFFIVKRKGKQIRPMFVFLVAKLMGNGKIDESLFDHEIKNGGAVIFDEAGVHRGSKTKLSDRMVLRFFYQRV